jgi:hypothetical protein
VSESAASSDLPFARSALAEAAAHLAAGRAPQAAEVLERALATGSWPAEIYNVLSHNLTGALRQACEEQIHRGDAGAARATAARMLALPPPQEPATEMLRHRAEFFHALGLAFFRTGMVPEALPCQRRAIALYPCPTYSNNLINTLALLRQPSVLSDYCDTLTSADLAPHLLIACQPKSGSTFLKNALNAVTGFRDVFLFHSSGQSEQELFFPSLLEFATIPTVTQQHCRATEANLQLMQAFGMGAVVLVRDLADVVISLRDFYNQGAVLGTFFHPDSWKALTPEQQTDTLIDHIVPWHFQFLAGWQQADRERRVPVLWLTYEELMAEKAVTVEKVLAFYNLAAPGDKIAAVLASLAGEHRLNRFNAGVSGRGREQLTPAQQARLHHLTAAYPGTDFSSFGL